MHTDTSSPPHTANAVRGMVLALIVSLAALAAPATAVASSYTWRVNADGDWTNPANWSLDPGSGPLGPGYPTARGDMARIQESLVLFTGRRTITIPDNVHITVGVVLFGSRFGITIRPGGPNARLDLDNLDRAAEMLRATEPDSNDLVAVPIRLLSPLLVTYSTGALSIESTIGEAGVARSLTKRGRGRLLLSPPDGNAYTGPTLIEGGELVLGHEGAPAVLGELVVGETGSFPVPATVNILVADQVADFASVRVLGNGRLTVLRQERVADLTIERGSVAIGSSGISLPQPPSLTCRNLAMTGGAIEATEGGRLALEGNVTAVSSAVGPAVIRRRDTTAATLDLLGATRTFLVNQGPAATHDLELNMVVTGSGGAGITKTGPGRMRLTGFGDNTYPGVTLVREGRVEVAKAQNALAIPAGGLQVGDGSNPVAVEFMGNVQSGLNIASAATISVAANAILAINSAQDFASLGVSSGGQVTIGAAGEASPLARSLAIVGGRIDIAVRSALVVDGDIVASSTAGRQAVIDGAGRLRFVRSRTLFVLDGPESVDLRVQAALSFADDGIQLTKRDPGVVAFGGTDEDGGGLAVTQGTVLVTGSQRLRPLTLAGGTLGGTGRIGPITAASGRIAPGIAVGRLASGAISLSSTTTLAMDVTGPTPGTGHDQLAVAGGVNLAGARLEITAGTSLPATPALILVDNDGTDPVTGTFADLEEGARVSVGERVFTITYRGGDGNDVVLEDESAPVTYYLAEGATGTFFDDDLLLANPGTTDAPVTLTFLLEDGRTIVDHRHVPARTRLTVHVDDIPGLEATSASVQVTSDARVPLVVERTMFWDAGGYGGHTANAVAQPETRWIFAEGFQGFFDTFVLIANANDEPATVTVTFLLEGGAPVVTTVTVGARARRTLYAGDHPALAGRAFGIVVEATLPVMAERAMYFASQPGRLWAGGHANTGIVAASTSWFHAEGATGGYFSTFLLLSNPNDSPAEVQLRFLLSTGETITRRKTLPALARLTVNPAVEGDARLLNAAVSTVVESDLPIVSERSMYWPGGGTPFGEGHNSAGVTGLATRWGLAEGRLGGARQYDTYILLANPGDQAATVTVTYLREQGDAIVQTYTVPPTSRFNIDVKTAVPALRESAFGARIEVTNGVPIAVERSLYWNAGDQFWAGGSNALGTPLP